MMDDGDCGAIGGMKIEDRFFPSSCVITNFLKRTICVPYDQVLKMYFATV
jgi:hypothetical protein